MIPRYSMEVLWSSCSSSSSPASFFEGTTHACLRSRVGVKSQPAEVSCCPIRTEIATVMSSIVIERDLAVPMRDGVRLFANLFRPAG